VTNGMQPSDKDPNFVRRLVTSTPLREAPVTAVVEKSADNTVGVSGSSNTAWNTHLAQLLHSMYLVTFTEKAQLGAMYGPVSAAGVSMQKQTATAATNATEVLPLSGAPTTLDSVTAASPHVCSHSITVDSRWLDAVTRYCHCTTTLDDVARVAMVFPALLYVRWSMEQQERHAIDASYVEELSEQPHESRSFAAAASSPVGKLAARVYLLNDHVISLEEATEQLTQSLCTKGSSAAQRAWRALVNHHTAYAAYVDGQRHSDVRGATDGGLEQVPRDHSEHNEVTASTSRKLGKGERKPPEEDDAVEDEVLCATLSAELRASLSAAKLHALLRQMRKDAAHVEEAEQHCIAQRQLQERMLNAYEHVRALYGAKDTQGRSASALITAMQEESRFEDALDIKALLSSLLETPASGLSATMLREECVVAAPLTPTPAKDVVTRRKRKRVEGEKEKGSAEPPVVVRVIEPSLEAVTDLRHLSDAQLEVVLVRLDRAKGSVKGVLEAITRKEQ
jgi:hypothetical protein